MDILERLNSGELYSCRDLPPEMKQQFVETQDLAHLYNQTLPSDSEKREEIIRRLIPDLGEHACIEQPLRLAYGHKLHIGDYFYANFNLTMVNEADIYIGNHVMFAPNVTISTTGHPVHYQLRPRAEQFSLPVRIGDYVWIGANVIILPGVTIGDHSVIGAGSIVTHDIPANVVALGTPCRVIREITGEDLIYDRKGHKALREE